MLPGVSVQLRKLCPATFARQFTRLPQVHLNKLGDFPRVLSNFSGGRINYFSGASGNSEHSALTVEILGTKNVADFKFHLWNTHMILNFTASLTAYFFTITTISWLSFSNQIKTCQWHEQSALVGSNSWMGTRTMTATMTTSAMTPVVAVQNSFWWASGNPPIFVSHISHTSCEKDQMFYPPSQIRDLTRSGYQGWWETMLKHKDRIQNNSQTESLQPILYNARQSQNPSLKVLISPKPPFGQSSFMRKFLEQCFRKTWHSRQDLLICRTRYRQKGGTRRCSDCLCFSPAIDWDVVDGRYKVHNNIDWTHEWKEIFQWKGNPK